MYNIALDKVDEIVKISLDFNDDIFSENIASIYSEILHCEDNPTLFQNLLCEICFLVDEVSISDDRNMVDEIESLIEEIREILE